jgi:hypothetical protein
MDEYQVYLSNDELRNLLDEDPTFWPGYEEWLDDVQATEEIFLGEN